MNTELRKLPGVDKLLNYSQIIKLSEKYGEELIKFSIRQNLESTRTSICENKITYHEEILLKRIKEFIMNITDISLKSVINATGIVLHTNLGRAPLGEAVLKDISPIISGYSNLEFNLTKGSRGNRNAHFQNILKYLTGAEDSLIVNNNAAAVFICLKTFSEGKEVIISRGELVEIGGSFRIPDIIKLSGVKMVEVGTTNRTRLSDYENAITENTKIIFKVHKSNYYIDGFTEETELAELIELAHKHDILVIYDIGSGLLIKPENLNLKDEPDIKTSIDAGADIITFSGDKLLGGAQAGIICGKDKYLKKISKSPLMRVLRVGKLTIAVLLSVLKNYLKEEDLIKNIPIFYFLSRSEEELLRLAVFFKNKLKENSLECRIVNSLGKTGGGTLPKLEISSYAVELILSPSRLGINIYFELMKLPKPVVGILKEGKLYFDLFTITETEIEYIVENIKILVDRFMHNIILKQD